MVGAAGVNTKSDTVMLWRAAAVSLNPTGEPLRLATRAVSVLGPGEAPSVRWTDATPFDPVLGFVGEIDPPPAYTPHVTATPAFGFPCPSRTITLCAVGNALFTMPT